MKLADILSKSQTWKELNQAVEDQMEEYYTVVADIKDKLDELAEVEIEIHNTGELEIPKGGH